MHFLALRGVRAAALSTTLMVLVACSSSSTDPTTGADAAAPTDAGTDAPVDAPAESSVATASCPGLTFTASCLSKDICFDMYGAPEATTKGACPSAVGTWQATPCVTTGHVGGCERTGTPAPGACMVQWYYPPTYKADKTKQDCAPPATLHAP
jgi:hypothetical protein